MTMVNFDYLDDDFFSNKLKKIIDISLNCRLLCFEFHAIQISSYIPLKTVKAGSSQISFNFNGLWWWNIKWRFSSLFENPLLMDPHH
jgi:hypothetical protein